MKTVEDVQRHCDNFYQVVGAWPSSVKVTNDEMKEILKDADNCRRRMMPYHDDEFIHHTYRNLVVYCPGGPVNLEIMDL